jgi:hypothetical protein
MAGSGCGEAQAKRGGAGDNVAVAVQGVFVFAEDGVEYFPSVKDAAAYVEAIDGENGVYEAFFTVDGERLVPQASTTHV